MKEKPEGVGKSSFPLIDTERLFYLLDLRKDSVLVDMACGRGDYSIAASRFIGGGGRIYALDRWQEGLRILKKVLSERTIENVLPILGDIARGLPIGDHFADVCLMAAVFHDLVRASSDSKAMVEVGRILKPGGLLAVVDFKKIAGPPGPSAEEKVSQEELENILKPHGFLQRATMEIGRHHYLSLFVHARV